MYQKCRPSRYEIYSPLGTDRTLRNLTHGFRFPSNDVMEKKWFEQKIVQGPPEHAIFVIQSDIGDPVGIAQLSPISFLHRNAKLGIYIAEKNSQMKGLGSRALNELLKFGFDDLNLHKIYLEVTSTNLNAINLYTKFAFKNEGLLGIIG